LRDNKLYLHFSGKRNRNLVNDFSPVVRVEATKIIYVCHVVAPGFTDLVKLDISLGKSPDIRTGREKEPHWVPEDIKGQIGLGILSGVSKGVSGGNRLKRRENFGLRKFYLGAWKIKSQ